MAKKSKVKWGPWSFIVGLAIAVIVGAISTVADNNVAAAMAVIGIVVGIICFAVKETKELLELSLALLFAIALATFTVSAGMYTLGQSATFIFQYITMITAPVAIILAIKRIYLLTK